jgi:hypothetical protein
MLLWDGAGGMRMDLAGLFSDLVRLEIELWNAVDARLRAVHDLPLARFEPMQVIARTPQCRVQDIATELSITVGGTSKIVDRLEAAGLCRRQPDPDDGRSSLIELNSLFASTPPPRRRRWNSSPLPSANCARGCVSTTKCRTPSRCASPRRPRRGWTLWQWSPLSWPDSGSRPAGSRR